MSQGTNPIVKEDVFRVLDADLPWSRLSGARVVVTGASGFIGAFLCRTLLALNTQARVAQPVHVVAMGRDIGQTRLRFQDEISNPYLSFQAWDLAQLATPDLGHCDYVFHAASQASPRFYDVDPIGTLAPNCVGTLALLQAMAQHGAKGFVYLSSSEVYGTTSLSAAIREDTSGHVDPATVRACYAESKRMGETICTAWTHQRGLPTYIVRPFHTYGPGLKKGDGRVFADFTYQVAHGNDLHLTSDGQARRAFCYISDAVSGIFHVLLKGQPAHPYNVANPQGVLSIIELANLLVGLFPERGLKVIRSKPPDGYLPSPYSVLIPDVTRLHDLGWQAKISPSLGFRRTIEAFRHELE